MFQAWISEENNLWTIEEDKVTMAILKIWEVREANSKVQEANREVHEAKARTRKGVQPVKRQEKDFGCLTIDIFC